MLPAARILLPVSLSMLVVIYEYFRSGRKTEILDPPSVPSPAPSDLDPEILDWIRTLDPAVLNKIRNLDPAFLDVNRNFDPAFSSKFSKSVDGPPNPPSVPSPAPTDLDSEFLDWIRKLSLKGKEEKEEEEKRRECERENEKENENGGEVDKKVVEESLRRNQYPLRPEAGDCSYYLRTGNCKLGSNCKYNHPRIRKNKQVSTDKAKQREELEEKQDQTESKYYICPGQRIRVPSVATAPELNFSGLPIRPHIDLKVSKDKATQREELEEKQDQTESKYYISPGRRIGVPSVAPALELNFLGLPIRPGVKDCPYYMRTGTCKYETNCKFNHSDPTAAVESRPQSVYGNGRPDSLQGLPKSQGINSETTEWNGYQASAYLPHRNMPAPPPAPYVMNNSVTETNYYGQHAQKKQAEEFPERPGQPVCFYCAQTGDCINKSNCQYHHPKNHTPATPSCTLNDKGLPLRPGQNICTQYSRYGLCSSGPTCRFDHPSLSGSFL